MRRIEIFKNWFGEKSPELFEKDFIEIQSGVTVLVGCNGSGKTTLMCQIRQNLHKESIPFADYNNLSDGGQAALENALGCGNMGFLATAAQSSEGENIIINLGAFASKVKQKVLKAQKNNQNELWIFWDAADSGLSIDNVVSLKKLFNAIEEDCNNKGITAYIIVSANEYEMARGEQCFDVISGEYITFSDYESYRNFILETAEKKEKRENGL